MQIVNKWKMCYVVLKIVAIKFTCNVSSKRNICHKGLDPIEKKVWRARYSFWERAESCLGGLLSKEHWRYSCQSANHKVILQATSLSLWAERSVPSHWVPSSRRWWQRVAWPSGGQRAAPTLRMPLVLGALTLQHGVACFSPEKLCVVPEGEDEECATCPASTV